LSNSFKRVVHATPPVYSAADMVRVYHLEGEGENADLLTSLRRCVIIATNPSSDGIYDLQSTQQRLLGLKGRRFELRGDEEMSYLEERYKVAINVHTVEGATTRSSPAPAEHTQVDVMEMGEGVYRLLRDVNSVQRSKVEGWSACSRGRSACKRTIGSPSRRRFVPASTSALDATRWTSMRDPKTPSPSRRWWVLALAELRWTWLRRRWHARR
jgi:hypothetical protein